MPDATFGVLVPKSSDLLLLLLIELIVVFILFSFNFKHSSRVGHSDHFSLTRPVLDAILHESPRQVISNHFDNILHQFLDLRSFISIKGRCLQLAQNFFNLN